ncbi:MAG: alpha/beta fold hydrolase [Labilithrix sp.]|nr:alpha/beta fold hydrolase [Labilithrix sp.]MCW5812605.1 alpha/beta fold hydrolase [Labilithrix sp.]
MKAALPPDKLGATWDALIAQLGALRGWTIVRRAHTDGKDVRVARLDFERGVLLALVSIAPPSQEIAGLFFKPAPTEATTAPYVDLSAFRAEEVSVGRAPFVLQGTLTVPNGAGPFPAAVLVHGSGPHDRDETIGANRPFKDIAEGLSSRGVAVLRYEKRTFQHGAKLDDTITLDDEVVVDAVAAVDLLRARSDVDAGRVFVIGHSLGALLAPEIAARAAPVAGAILLAPPGRPPWDSVLAQMRYLEAPPAILAEVEAAIDLLKAGKLGAGKLLGAPASYWQDWAARDGVATAKELGKPILVLRGERDYQVTDEDVATWRDGLSAAEDAVFVTVPHANHLLIPGHGKPGPAEYETPGHVDASVVARLADFVLQGRIATFITPSR